MHTLRQEPLNLEHNWWSVAQSPLQAQLICGPTCAASLQRGYTRLYYSRKQKQAHTRAHTCAQPRAQHRRHYTGLVLNDGIITFEPDNMIADWSSCTRSGQPLSVHFNRWTKGLTLESIFCDYSCTSMAGLKRNCFWKNIHIFNDFTLTSLLWAEEIKLFMYFTMHFAIIFLQYILENICNIMKLKEWKNKGMMVNRFTLFTDTLLLYEVM